MFSQLIVQIKHQYGKYLNFHNAYTNSKESVFGASKGFHEDETIVRFVPKSGGYQIKHQYGKYLCFHNAYNSSKEPVFGMSQGYNEDETVVHFIPKNGGYQIKHQYGKYLYFHNAYNEAHEPVFGASQDYHEDETIVHFIPKNYTFSISIEDYKYDTSRVYDAQLKGRVQNVSLISKTFANYSNSKQKHNIRESVAFNTGVTFEHSTTDVKNWLSRVSVGIKITTEGKVALPLVTEEGTQGETSFSYKYTWSKESTEQFNNGTTESIAKTINVTDEVNVEPRSKVTYRYVNNQLSGIAIPYQAVMKIKCKMGEIYVSDQALEFILNHVGSLPPGNVTMENGHGVYRTKLIGVITPNIALNLASHCDSQPLHVNNDHSNSNDQGSKINESEEQSP